MKDNLTINGKEILVCNVRYNPDTDKVYCNAVLGRGTAVRLIHSAEGGRYAKYDKIGVLNSKFQEIDYHIIKDKYHPRLISLMSEEDINIVEMMISEDDETRALGCQALRSKYDEIIRKTKKKRS